MADPHSRFTRRTRYKPLKLLLNYSQPPHGEPSNLHTTSHECSIRHISYLLFFVICSLLSTTGHSAPCGYQTPRVDEIVLGVDLESPLGTEHRAKREVVDDEEDEFRSLRIHLHYDHNVLLKSEETFHYIEDVLMKPATTFWEKSLRVRRASGPILLKRKCNETFYLWDKNVKQLACGKGCAIFTFCGDTEIPLEHLQPCHYCQTDGGGCATEGVAGPGIANADFVLYVSSYETKRCGKNDTLAYAAHCQQEALLDRPIAGHVNLCPAALSTHVADREVLVSTIKHEILHALGFSAGLFAFYRDDEGQPRTKRNAYGKPRELNREKGYYKWDRSTIDTVLREEWWTAEGPVTHPIDMVVTPRVRKEARTHFRCPTLEGAELENQGGEGTALTHWEKRVYENEAMTGTHTQNPVYSRLTFALLEDTGWYRANYDMAEDLHWGSQLGCEFAKKSCGEWIAMRRENKSSLLPYCEHIKHDGRRSLAVTKCTLQRDSVALCNLIPYTQPLPKQFRNLAHLNGVQAQGLRYYGGSVELADFCPFNQEFEWRTTSETERRRDSRCEIDSNRLDDDELMEVYGHSSRCIDFVRPWTEKKCGRVRTFSQYMAGCYERACINGTLHIGLHNSTELYPCRYEGQHVHIRRIVNGWLREGTLSCPKCEELCAECYPDENMSDEVGDEQLDEPCSTKRATITLVLLSILMLFVESLSP